MESKRKTTPLSSSVPPSKRVHGNLQSPPVPSKPASIIAGGGGEEEEEEGDVDVFMEELLLQDEEELRESGIEGLTSRLSKWRRPSLAQDVHKHNIGMSLDSVSRFFFPIETNMSAVHMMFISFEGEFDHAL